MLCENRDDGSDGQKIEKVRIKDCYYRRLRELNVNLINSIDKRLKSWDLRNFECDCAVYVNSSLQFIKYPLPKFKS